jgi:hypothetical protein
MFLPLYSSMHPCIWGPSAWKFLHAITFNYPEQPTESDIRSVIEFFRSLPSVLPCDLCSKHLLQNYKNLPPEDHTQNRATLVRWLFDLHNKVNESLNKPIKDFDEFISETKKEADYYKDKPLNMVCSRTHTIRTILWITIILVLLIALIWTNRHHFKTAVRRR